MEAADLADALGFANDYAPEHLSVVVADDEAAARRDPQRRVAVPRRRTRPSRRATTPPARTTSCRPGGWPAPTARSASRAFGRWLQVQRVTREGLASVRETVGVVAEAEGLSAHRRAVEVRFE